MRSEEGRTWRVCSTHLLQLRLFSVLVLLRFLCLATQRLGCELDRESMIIRMVNDLRGTDLKLE